MTDLTTEARGILDGVTDGPWHVDGYHTSAVIVRDTVQTWKWHRIADCDTKAFPNPRWAKDAAFIARSRTLVPELTSALEDANADNARLREALEARERDLSLVLASLRNLEAATEEYLAEEEGVLIGEIEDEQKLRSIHRAAEPTLGALGTPCDLDIDYSGDHK